VRVKGRPNRPAFRTSRWRGPGWDTARRFTNCPTEARLPRSRGRKLHLQKKKNKDRGHLLFSRRSIGGLIHNDLWSWPMRAYLVHNNAKSLTPVYALSDKHSSGTTDLFGSGTVTHKTATKDRKLSTVHQKILVAEHFSHTYCSGF
jgi:hypothetical protein